MNNCTTLILKIAALSILLLLMTACGSGVKRGSGEFANEQQNLDALLQQANQAEPSEKHPLLLQVVNLLLLKNKNDKALEILQHIDNRFLSAQQKDTYHLSYGEALLSNDLAELEDSQRASLSQLLKILTPSRHPIEWQIRYFQSFSDSYFANGNFLEAARQRIDINDLIDNVAALEENNDKIWAAINQMSPQFLQQTATSFNSQRLNGWLEIVRIYKIWGSQPDRLLAEIDLWKKRYPLHTASVVQPKSLQRLTRTDKVEAKNIAVLLPLSGRFSRSGKMVHDGVVAAHYRHSGIDESPNIRFYDTAKTLSGLTAYRQAIRDGADFVIGPLLKKPINEILSQDLLATPALFLNSTQNRPQRHPMAFQFVLSIEDEAIQAAQRAWEKGYRKAIAFVPEGKRGERAVAAFKGYFERLGGETVDTEKYGDIKKINGNIENLLRVNASKNRKKRLERILGRNLEFRIRRRQDADFIFLLSKPKEARRIKPFINFYFALDLPVISTSDIYSGAAGNKLDNDLNGIEFPDIPLYISQQQDIVETRKAIQKIDSNILKGSNGRMFALGFDAYQIIPQLTKLRAFPYYRWYGLSGEIGIDEEGLVHRYLAWAKYENGSIQTTKERLPPKPEAISTRRYQPL